MDITFIVDEILQELNPVPQIKTEDIPNIDLYMDQLVTYLDDNLLPLQRDQQNPFVTKTMVNNYTKLKLMSPADKKKYKQHHILQIALIVQLKRLLPMQDISKIATHLTEDNNQLYNLFLQAQQQAFAQLDGDVKTAIKQTDQQPQLTKDEQARIAATAMQLVVNAQSQLLLAEKLLDKISADE